MFSMDMWSAKRQIRSKLLIYVHHRLKIRSDYLSRYLHSVEFLKDGRVVDVCLHADLLGSGYL
jgi:hypothetical protein